MTIQPRVFYTLCIIGLLPFPVYVRATANLITASIIGSRCFDACFWCESLLGRVMFGLAGVVFSIGFFNSILWMLNE